MGYLLGVDLGTTFVAAARSDRSQIEMVTLGDRSVVMPSVLYVGEDGNVVTGEAATRRAMTSPERVARQFKRRLGDPTPLRVGDTVYSATDLLGMLLRDVLARVTETEGEAPGQVVLTHPASWGPFRRRIFEEVPRIAGISDALTITEPEAAAVRYAASRRLRTGEMMAVYDLGGGTFDATVVRKVSTGVRTVGTPEGVERLGGLDFDQALFDFVDDSSNGALNQLDEEDPKTVIALARLRQDCALAKEALSVDTETLIPVFLPDRHFDIRITREKFEDLIRARIESTITALSRALRSAQVTADELSAVLLVGGSSRIPLIARMVSEELGRPILLDTHPKYAVALGAATLSTAQPAARQATPAPLPWETVPGRRRGWSARRRDWPGRPRRRNRHRPRWAAGGALAAVLAGVAVLIWASPPGASNARTGSPPAVLAQPQLYPVNWRDTWSVAISPHDQPLFVPDGARLRIVDPDTYAVRDELTLPNPAWEVERGPDGTRAYVQTGSNSITPVDTRGKQPADDITLPGHIVSFSITGDGQHLVALTVPGAVSVLDLATGALRSASLGVDPAEDLEVSPDGHRAYVPTRTLQPALVEVDLDHLLVTTIDVPVDPTDARIPRVDPPLLSPDGRWLYAAAARTVVVLDTTTNTVQRRIPQRGGALTAALALAPSGRYLYVCTEQGELRVIDLSGDRLVSTGKATATPRGSLVVSEDGRKLYLMVKGGLDVFDTSAFS